MKRVLVKAKPRPANCNLSNEIRPELGQLQNVDTLFLQVNALSRSLTSELGYLKSLKSMDLSNNLFSGEILVYFTELKNLTLLNLFRNQLHDAIQTSSVTFRSSRSCSYGRTTSLGLFLRVWAEMGSCKSWTCVRMVGLIQGEGGRHLSWRIRLKRCRGRRRGCLLRGEDRRITMYRSRSLTLSLSTSL